jgi:hypothetical protein
MNKGKLVKKLEQAAARWRDSLKAIGEVLLELKTAGEPVNLHQDMLKDRYSIPVTTSTVAMRWANGDFGEHGEMLIGKIKHSILATMSPEVITATIEGRHLISSPDENRVVEKTLSEMSAKEANRNISPQGFIPIAEQQPKEPAFRHCRATSIEWDEDGGLTLVSNHRTCIRMTISAKLVAEIRANEPAKEAV